MDSESDTPRGVGCPIRISTDQSLLAAPRGFSQRATSFIASWCQGIHRMPFSRSRSSESIPKDRPDPPCRDNTSRHSEPLSTSLASEHSFHDTVGEQPKPSTRSDTGAMKLLFPLADPKAAKEIEPRAQRHTKT